MTGALGTVTYRYNAPPTVMNMIMSFNLNANDIAEVVGVITAQGQYDWMLMIPTGADGRWIGPNSGRVNTGLKNTFTFKAILQASATGSHTVSLITQRYTINNVVLTDALVRVKMIGRFS